jgi:hypothetical protein
MNQYNALTVNKVEIIILVEVSYTYRKQIWLLDLSDFLKVPVRY